MLFCIVLHFLEWSKKPVYFVNTSKSSFPKSKLSVILDSLGFSPVNVIISHILHLLDAVSVDSCTCRLTHTLLKWTHPKLSLYGIDVLAVSQSLLENTVFASLYLENRRSFLFSGIRRCLRPRMIFKFWSVRPSSQRHLLCTSAFPTELIVTLRGSRPRNEFIETISFVIFCSFAE